MFKPCPKCGFLVALIAGREASQRCPRCGSALLSESELLEIEDVAAAAPHRATPDAGAPPAATREATAHEHRAPASARHSVSALADAQGTVDTERSTAPESGVARPTAPAHAGAAADSVPADPVTATASKADAPTVATPTSPAAAHDGPSFARRRGRPTGGRPWPWLVALPLLALLLAVQLLLAQRAELARDAAWRPLVLRACSLLGCDVPAWREPQAYAMLARNVRPSGTRPGVLHVTATVRNDARWPQAAPVVVLSLSDVDGRVVGARAVAPAEYGRRGGASIAPGDSVDIVFDVREPATHVESFDFQLQ